MAFLTIKVQRQRLATDGNGFGLFLGFGRRRVCRRLPLIAPAALHKRSIPGGPFRSRLGRARGRSRIPRSRFLRLHRRAARM
jgi:hypothetical protein